MTVKAGAGVALMLAAGLIVSFAGPSPATAAGRDSETASKSDSATSDKSVRQGSRSLKKRYAHRKDARVASNAAETKKVAEKEVADASGNAQPAIPKEVADANAQMTSADAGQDNARPPADDIARAMSEAMSAKANTILLASADKPADGPPPADSEVVASDQLNDVDRALQEAPSTQTVAMAQARPAQEAPVLASSESASLDKTSLIGKIFIAFGALLTMASAARMFMA